MQTVKLNRCGDIEIFMDGDTLRVKQFLDRKNISIPIESVRIFICAIEKEIAL